MRAGVSLQTRREILQHMLPQYRKACSVKRKSKLLDAFTAATGYDRKYAMGLLNHVQEVQPTLQRPRPRQYGPVVQHGSSSRALYPVPRAGAEKTRLGLAAYPQRPL